MNNPEKRTANLLKFFGYTGGTIHQIAAETGVDAQTLLYGDSPYNDRYAQGRLAIECASREMCLGLVKYVKGDRSFWLGVAG
jgi:hypothetical protein